MDKRVKKKRELWDREIGCAGRGIRHAHVVLQSAGSLMDVDAIRLALAIIQGCEYTVGS